MVLSYISYHAPGQYIPYTHKQPLCERTCLPFSTLFLCSFWQFPL
jgi:hypothetical protein